MAYSNKTGTGFTNLSKYINANQNNGLADTLSQGINNATDAASQDLTNQTTDFNNNAQQNNYNTDANSQYVSNLVNDPTKATDQDYGKFAQYRTGGYAGPTSLNDTQRLTNEANTAQQYGDSLNNQGGKFTLLQNFVGNGNTNGYTSGQQNLDSMLIGNNQNLNQAQKKANDTYAQIRQGIQSASDTANNIAQNNQQFGNQTKAMLGLDNNGNLLTDKDSTTGDYTHSGVYQNLYNGINDIYNKNLNDFKTNYGNITTDLSAGKLNQAESQMGLPDYGTQFGIDPSKYITTNKPTFANSENQGQYDKMTALSKLAGLNNTLPTVDTNQYDPTKAIQFQADQYNQDVMNGANTAAQPLIDQLNQIAAAANATQGPIRGNLNGNATPGSGPYQAPLQGIEGQLNNIYGKIGKSWASNPAIAPIIQKILSGNFYDNTNGAYQPDQNPGVTGPTRGGL